MDKIKNVARRKPLEIGTKYNHLTIIADVPYVAGVSRQVIAQCDCGKIKKMFLGNVRRGRSISCGCIQIASVIKRNHKHGLSRERLCHIWIEMKRRCNDPKRNIYRHYGGRGINVCNDWMDDFLTFYNWAISNGYADNLEIDRIDVNGNYEPVNCRWVTRSENMLNKRDTPYLEYNGIRKPVNLWAKEYGMRPQTLTYRLKKWDAEKALNEPLNLAKSESARQ